MKRKLIAIVLSCVMLSMVGCGSSTTSTATDVSTDVKLADEASTTVSTKESESTTEAESSTEPKQRENADFKNACWGDDMETVKKNETLKDSQIENADNCDYLCYATTLNGSNVTLAYKFVDSKLVSAVYLLNEDLSTGGQYLDILNDWKDSLVKKYGEPNSTNDNGVCGKAYSVSEDQANSVDEGTALQFGYTAYLYVWKMDKTQMYLQAASNNYDIGVSISYVDINYDENSEDQENF